MENREMTEGGYKKQKQNIKTVFSWEIKGYDYELGKEDWIQELIIWYPYA